MSAERLREAARLMRERAGNAAIMAPPPWWSKGVWYHHFPVVDGEPGEMEAQPWPAVGYGDTGADVVGHNVRRELSDHIASWHPPVAFAVADWLEYASKYAAWCEKRHPDAIEADELISGAVSVANAYLGSA